jgi:hypothetical protein
MTVGAHALTESILPAMTIRSKKPIDRKPLELNPYAYVVNNPVNRIDPSGMDEGEGDNGPGPGDSGEWVYCPLVAQFMINMMPKYGISIWYCIYDCNTTCPGSMDKIKGKVEWTVSPYHYCPDRLLRKELLGY